MEKEVSASYEASKTNKSCILINTSENITFLFWIGTTALFCAMIFGFQGKLDCDREYTKYCSIIAVLSFILIILLKYIKRTRIKKTIDNNKNNFTYRIDGKIYELQQGTKEEWYHIKSKEYDFIVLTNQFSVNGNGVAYVIRDKSTLSDPDAKIYIDKSYSEEIEIFYDQITEIKTGKILNAAELKQFLKAEESN